MKFKSLVAEFGFVSLEELCKEKGWRIPTRAEIGSLPTKCEHRVFWVADLPQKEEDRKTHAMLFDCDRDALYLVNKNFIEHAVVVVEQRG